jgi:hypothetical protein
VWRGVGSSGRSSGAGTAPSWRSRATTYAPDVDRLRAILLLRGALALFLLVLGVVLLATGDIVFGIFAVVAALVNAGLILVLVRRARRSA